MYKKKLFHDSENVINELDNLDKLDNEFSHAKRTYLTAQKRYKENIEDAIPYYIEARDHACIAYSYTDEIICKLHDMVRSKGASDDFLNYLTDFMKTEVADELIKIIKHCDDILEEHLPEEEKKKLNNNEFYRMFKLLSAPTHI